MADFLELSDGETGVSPVSVGLCRTGGDARLSIEPSLISSL